MESGDQEYRRGVVIGLAVGEGGTAITLNLIHYSEELF